MLPTSSFFPNTTYPITDAAVKPINFLDRLNPHQAKGLNIVLEIFHQHIINPREPSSLSIGWVKNLDSKELTAVSVLQKDSNTYGRVLRHQLDFLPFISEYDIEPKTVGEDVCVDFPLDYLEKISFLDTIPLSFVQILQKYKLEEVNYLITKTHLKGIFLICEHLQSIILDDKLLKIGLDHNDITFEEQVQTTENSADEEVSEPQEFLTSYKIEVPLKRSCSAVSCLVSKKLSEYLNQAFGDAFKFGFDKGHFFIIELDVNTIENIASNAQLGSVKISNHHF